MSVQCPICKKVVPTPKDKDGKKPPCLPFCSEQCKLIDLGRWLDSDYRITVKEDENEDEQSPEDI